MTSLNQFARVAGTSTYKFGHNSIPNIPVTGLPADADPTRWSMLHDGGAYRLYFFKAGSNDTLYQCAFDGKAYVFGHDAIPVLTLAGFPADADASSFAMLHDGSAYRLYLRRHGDPTQLYQAAYDGGAVYRFGYDSLPQIAVIGFPGDTDWARWMMLHDGVEYRIYAFKIGSDTELYQGAFNRTISAYQHGYNSSSTLTLVDTPADSDTRHAAMLHDNVDYRLYFQTKKASVPVPVPVVKGVVAAMNQDGRLEVFAIGADGSTQDMWQERPFSGSWGGRASLGGVVKQLTAAMNQDGRLEVFGIGSDDGLYNIWQTRPAAGPWSAWAGLGGVVKKIAVAMNQDGRLEVFGIGSDDGLYNIWQTAPGAGWSGWAGLGGKIKDLAVVENQDGRLEVFAIGMDDAVWHTSQARAGAGPWSAWTSLDGAVKQIAAARNQDGRIEVFAIGMDNALWNIWQTLPGSGPWSAWTSLGGVVKQIAAIRNQDGRLEVFGIGSDDGLYGIWQTRPAKGPWSAWAGLGGVVRTIAVARNQDGRLEVFAIGMDDALWNIWQTRPAAGPWSGWSRLG